MPHDRKNGDRAHNESRSERESLERREYRGPRGEIHHHTRTYMEQHGGSRRNHNKSDKGR